MKKLKEITATTAVLEALQRADDFRTVSHLQVATGQSMNRVRAALHHLHKYRVVECMASDGRLWWYATPENDQRTLVVDERTPEAKPRKQRKGRKKQ